MSPSLREALVALLPDSVETLLLRSCLAEGEACRRAWEELQHSGRELTELFRTDYGELKRLGPLLLKNLGRNAIDADSRLLTVLRTSYLREELRARIYLEVYGEASRALAAAGVQPVALRGAAHAESLYGDPALRHSHDIDLLIPESQLARASAALQQGGFQPGTPYSEASGQAVVTHRTSLPVRLHTSLFELSALRFPSDRLRGRSRVTRIGGEPARILAPEHALAQSLGHAAYSPGRATLQWACDAWLLLERHPDLDAELLAESLATAQLALPASVLLDYLAETGAPVRGELPAAITARAGRPSRLERDLALYGVRRSLRGGLPALLRRLPTRRAKLEVLGWVLLPSPAYVRWAHRPQVGALTPAFYLIRALRAAGVAGRGADARG